MMVHLPVAELLGEKPVCAGGPVRPASHSPCPVYNLLLPAGGRGGGGCRAHWPDTPCAAESTRGQTSLAGYHGSRWHGNQRGSAPPPATPGLRLGSNCS